MVNELFEIEKVKIEFLEGVAEEYSKIFTERQLEMSVYMLNEFCNICASNNLALIRIPEQVAEQQMNQYQVPQQDPFQNIPEMPQVRPPQQFQQQYELMRAQGPPPMPPVEEVDLSSDKPKTFAEKIREMRGAPKKQPGNKVNPGED